MEKAVSQAVDARTRRGKVLRQFAFYVPLALCIYSFFFGFPIRLRIRRTLRLIHTPSAPEDPNTRALCGMMASNTPAAKIRAATLAAVAKGEKLSGKFGLQLVDDAVGTNRADVLKMLIRHHAPVNGVLESRFSPYLPPDRVSPLDDAVQLRRLRMVRMLLAAGAMISQRCPLRGGYFTTPYEDSENAGSKQIEAIFKKLSPNG